MYQMPPQRVYTALVEEAMPMMFDFDFAYYADRARQEREAARKSIDRANAIHRTLANTYVLRAMAAVVSDLRAATRDVDQRKGARTAANRSRRLAVMGASLRRRVTR
jgi:hypothetical protein